MGDGVTAIVCDDAPGFRALLSTLLEDAGVQVVARGETWAEAVAAATGDADAIVLDLWMPQFERDSLARVRELAPTAAVVVVTALDLDEARERIGDIAIDLLLSKIAPPTEVVAQIRAAAVAARERRRELTAEADGV
jgi:DNA-binding NarL/FixJ family response regulator